MMQEFEDRSPAPPLSRTECLIVALITGLTLYMVGIYGIDLIS